uniref:Uncharacterized protein n=1 Tax=Rousettus aegyptiacus TaxID=9407 RepID=A0A7J8JGV3_ROUAE|nr:hypothetical protein HJG63_010353 [Rousettus aegyptiacus]
MSAWGDWYGASGPPRARMCMHSRLCLRVPCACVSLGVLGRLREDSGPTATCILCVRLGGRGSHLPLHSPAQTHPLGVAIEQAETWMWPFALGARGGTPAVIGRQLWACLNRDSETRQGPCKPWPLRYSPSMGTDG